MSAEDALRFVDNQASCCRHRDDHEALCLLLPAILHVLALPKMDHLEAAAFRYRLKKELGINQEIAAR
jgi:hypothetical protein